MSLTREEILQQFDALTQTLEVTRSTAPQWQPVLAGRRLVLTGCGSSYTLCLSAAWLLKLRGVDAFAVPAGDLIAQPELYRGLMQGAALVTPSRSGKTSECLRAVELARSYDMPVVSLVADADSPLAAASDAVIALPFAYDHSVCQTRNVSCFYAAFCCMTGLLCNDQALLADLDATVQELPALFAAMRPAIERVATQKQWRNVFVLADSVLAGLGQEAALAFCEIARLPGEHKHLLDVRHGPMVLARQDTLVIMVTPWDQNTYLPALAADFVGEGHGSTVILLAPQAAGDMGEAVRVPLASGRDIACAGLPMIVCAQWLALSCAVARGFNPDAPEGLTAWISL